MEEDPSSGVDLSPLHRELDTLKAKLCRCQHQGTCIACQGFEMLRNQLQMVVAAASQPVLMQVAQEAAAKDLMSRLGNVQETLTTKIAEDSELQGMMGRMMERIQEDLGGPEAVQELMRGLGISPEAPETKPGPTPYDDLPHPQKPNDESPST